MGRRTRTVEEVAVTRERIRHLQHWSTRRHCEIDPRYPVDRSMDVRARSRSIPRKTAR